jgi:mRNA-degrading endonuclease RelE of RelBE toxin-antitoxin system
LRSLPANVEKRLRRTLRALEDEPWPDNLDVTAMVQHRPFLRVRDGNYRLYMRPLTDTELATLEIELPETGYLVARIVDKKHEKRTLRALRR